MHDETDERGEWPLRPWIMAAIGAAAGLLVHFLVKGISYRPAISTIDLVRQSLAAGVTVATLSFLITARRRRWTWAAGFALVWGAILGLVSWFDAGYNGDGEFMGFPFLSSVLAVGIAGPLFQTMRDEERRALPYDKVHRYAWTDAIIGGASLAFTGLTFLLAFLLGALFDAIGIDVLKSLLREGWFNLMVAGAAFGAASAVLRERDPLLGTLQRLVMLVFSVLAPVLAFALAIYLVALPVTGFSGLWKSGLPETPLLLSAAAFCFVFLNAIIGDSADDRKTGRMWRVTELVLLLAVLPLAVLALVSMGMRVGQYGWTPERLWGVLACLVATAFGAANWLALARGRGAFDGFVREYQKWLAVGLCGLALFLALPIVDFGAISTRSQLARLESGKVEAQAFDWAALKYDFGPEGRDALERIARSGPAAARPLAAKALASTDRYAIREEGRLAERAREMDANLILASPDIVITPDLRRDIARRTNCSASVRCKLVRYDANRLILLSSSDGEPGRIFAQLVDLREAGRGPDGMVEAVPPPVADKIDLSTATVEVRDVTMKQVYVGGQKVGPPFE